MHNVIIVVMMIAACLTFQPQVVGKSSSYDFEEKNMQRKHHFRFSNYHEQELISNKSSNVKMPQYMHIQDTEYKWPLLNISSFLKPQRHSSGGYCVLSRLDNTIYQ